MRLWIFVFTMIWGLIACSPKESILSPSPTSSPVELTVDDITIKLTSATGWRAYSSDSRITMSYQDNRLNNIIVNIWIPEINLNEYETVVDAAFDIADMMEDEQGINTTQPTAITWRGYNSAYFLVSNDEPRTSMILVTQVTDETVVALNIRGIVADFDAIRDRLAETFATFTVNDIALGNDVFMTLPETLILPSGNPEAALDPSSEP
ncbi:MAG: hypothetical protein AAFV93_16920 [Chloroflexota bacterium]